MTPKQVIQTLVALAQVRINDFYTLIDSGAATPEQIQKAIADVNAATEALAVNLRVLFPRPSIP